jgi:hypothetical protein
MHLAQVGPDLRRVGAGRDLVAAQAGEVVARHPLGDVRHGQVGHRPEADGLDLQQVEVPLRRPHDVAVGQHHALGRPRGAGRVDDGGQRLGRDQVECGLEVGGLVVGEDGGREHALGPRRARHQVVAAQRHDGGQFRELVAHDGEALEEPGVLDHRQLGVAVPGQVGDLVGRGRVVDRHRRRPAEHDRQVDDVELGDVAHHQHDAIAGLDPECPQARGRPGHPVGDVAVRVFDPPVAVPGPQGDACAVVADGLQPAAGERLACHGGVDARGLGGGAVELLVGAGHGAPLEWTCRPTTVRVRRDCVSRMASADS